MIEYLVGNKNPAMMRVHEHDAAASARLEAVRQAPSLYDLTIRALHKRGFAIDESYRILRPTIFMMKVAQDRPRHDLAEPLNGPTKRRILVQGQMWSEFVVVAAVGCEDPARTRHVQLMP